MKGMAAFRVFFELPKTATQYPGERQPVLYTITYESQATGTSRTSTQ